MAAPYFSGLEKTTLGSIYRPVMGRFTRNPTRNPKRTRTPTFSMGLFTINETSDLIFYFYPEFDIWKPQSRIKRFLIELPLVITLSDYYTYIY